MDEAGQLRDRLRRAQERESALQQRVGALKGEVKSLRRQLKQRDEQLEHSRQANERLERRLADLEMRVRQDSTTSSRPPRSDPEWTKETRRRQRNERKKNKGKRNRGAQKGHKGTRRSWVEPDHVQRHEPSDCAQCGQGLQDRPGQQVDKQQITELPEVRAVVTEHRSYAKSCPCCGHTTVTDLPREVKQTGSFGPKLRSTMALITGYYRVSRRQARQLLKDLFGVDLSVGSVSDNERRLSEALAAGYDDVSCFVRKSTSIHADETTWTQSNQLCWLWTAATPEAILYRFDPRRDTEAAKALLEGFEGLLTTDRYGSYNFHPWQKRQWCWAHIQRDVRHIAEHVAEGQSWAKRLLEVIQNMFRQWNRIRDGTDPWQERRLLMQPMQQQTEQLLDEGLQSDCKPVRTLARSLHKQRSCLWRFVIYGTDPTNNAAERALKPAVIWRKTSFGTQSDRGSRFVERMLTAVETLKAQGRAVLAFLKHTLHQFHRGAPLPLLAPGT